MSITARHVSDAAEIAELSACIGAGFGEVPRSEPDPLELKFAAARINELTIAVKDGERIIGGCFGLAMDYTLPGGTALPIAGLAGVGIDPSAVGRGGFRPMMTTHLASAKDLGLPASILHASEAGLYGRFGYGVVSTVCRYEAATAFAGLREPLTDHGEVRLLFDEAKAKTDLKIAHDRAAARSGMSSRTPAIWDIWFDPKQSWLGGGSRFFAAHYDADGTPDGYVSYKITTEWDGHGLANARAMVSEYVANSVAAELALWNYLVSLPLVRSVVVEHASTDPAVVHHLADPRQLVQTRRTDCVWLRPLDVERLLANRRYEADVDFSFDYVDPLFPDLSGTYNVNVNAGAGAVTRGGTSGGVSLSPAQLGSLLSGQYRASELRRAGILAGPAFAITAIDRAFATSQVPFSLTRF